MTAIGAVMEMKRLVGVPAIVVVSIGLGLSLYTVYLTEPGLVFPLTIAMTWWPYGPYAVAMLVIRARKPQWSPVYSWVVGLGLVASHVGLVWAYLLGRGQSSTDSLVLGLGAFAQAFLVIPIFGLLVLAIEGVSRLITRPKPSSDPAPLR